MIRVNRAHSFTEGSLFIIVFITHQNSHWVSEQIITVSKIEISFVHIKLLNPGSVKIMLFKCLLSKSNSRRCVNRFLFQDSKNDTEHQDLLTPPLTENVSIQCLTTLSSSRLETSDSFQRLIIAQKPQESCVNPA